MAEIQDDKERKKLYGLLVSDPATRKNTAQYSFKQWESKLLGDDENIKRVADYAVKKNWSYDQDEFYKKYAPEKLAKPQPQVQAAPAMQSNLKKEKEDQSNLNAFNQYGQRELFLKEIQKTPKDQIREAEEKNFALWPYANDDINKQIEEYGIEEVLKNIPLKVKDPRRQKTVTQTPSSIAAPVEEETYTPPPQPLVGSPEYDAKLQKQYGGMKPTLGATFGGAAASFDTDEQKKQEQISPVFKAQQLAFEDVPIASEQRKAQREFAKAEKQQQQAAIRGGTGFEYQQKQRNKERSIGGKAEDLLGAVTSGGERIAKNVLSGISWLNQASMAADPNMPLEYEQRQQQIKDAGQRMYDASTSSQNQFQQELAKRNIQTSVLEAIGFLKPLCTLLGMLQCKSFLLF